MRYMKDSDRGTKFFHDLVRRNNRRNAINALTTQAGEQLTEPHAIGAEFVSYFSTLLGVKDSSSHQATAPSEGRVLNSTQAASLIRPVSDDEVRLAMFSIGNDKAPGPDGYGALFFKSAWDIVGVDFTEAVQEFFRNGQLLRQWNHTLLALIPKGDHAHVVTDFRPISCCTVFYKVIAKILAGRLIQVMDYLVDKAQAAFIPGRLIGENIHLAQELLRQYARKRVSPRCMIKVDIKKAFDTVDWDFLLMALTDFGFPQQFIGWVAECVTTVTYSISISGGLHGFFGGRRGLRQGDPLSPLLFSLCLEVLSRRLRHCAQDPAFHYHPRCAELQITHLAYADDLLLFARADITSLSTLARCLEDFGDRAGLRANPLKTNIYMAGVDRQTREEILRLTGFQEGTFPFRYLGIPLATEKLRISDYSPLIDTVRQKVSSWPQHTLSYAGRLELVRSVLQGIECYWLSILPLPAGVTDRLYSICRAFVWATRHPPIAWSTVCLPRAEGGYGLRDLRAWNTALLCRTLWRIQGKADSLWVKWVHHRYLAHTDFWHWQARPGDSPLVKRLVQVRDLLVLQAGGHGEAWTHLTDWFAGASPLAAQAYRFFQPRGTVRRWAPHVWRGEILPKHRLTYWLLAHRRLRTADTMPYDPQKMCTLCHQSEETGGHIFFRCSYTRRIWDLVRAWLGIRQEIYSSTRLFTALGRELRGAGRTRKMRVAAITCMIYLVWQARNRSRFEHRESDIERMFLKIQTHVYRIVDN